MILDTNAISDLFCGNASLALVLAAQDRHHIPVIVLGEYRFGLISSRHRPQLEALLAILEADSNILYPDCQTAIMYAMVRHELKNAGTPIPENDVWIAALARQHEQAIVSKDGHFDHVQGLRRVAW